MLRVLFHGEVIARRSPALDAARGLGGAGRREQRFSQGGLAAARLADERERTYMLDSKLAHGDTSMVHLTLASAKRNARLRSEQCLPARRNPLIVKEPAILAGVSPWTELIRRFPCTVSVRVRACRHPISIANGWRSIPPPSPPRPICAWS